MNAQTCHDDHSDIHSLRKSTVHVYGSLSLDKRGVRPEINVAFAVDMLPVERGRLMF